MYAEIISAAKSAKALGELVKAARDLSNYTEFVAAVSEVSTKLMDATAVALASQEKQSTLSNQIIELEKKLREFENWESEIQRYELYEFPETKVLAYALKQDIDRDEPHHYLCATCVNKRQKTILQPSGLFLGCQVCDKNIQIKNSIPRNPVRSSGVVPWMR